MKQRSEGRGREGIREKEREVGEMEGKREKGKVRGGGGKE